MDRTYRLRAIGDFEGARKPLEELLSVEVVPLYRKQAETVLGETARIAAVAASGEVDPRLRDWEQLPALMHRIQQGKPLGLNDAMCVFLRRTSATVAISEAETEEALASPESAGALLERILTRIRTGERRINRALSRMLSLKDAGDMEGARQQMRDVLAVEVVPKFREMAQENLANLSEPPQFP